MAIIGGGIVGASMAARLAAAGAAVRLYEREAIGAAASGRNSGVVQHPFDPVLAALHLETVELYREPERSAPDRFTLPPTPDGLLAVGHDAASVQRLAAALAETHPALEPRYLAPGEASRVEPALAASVAACRLSIGYPVGPAAATRGWAAWARDLGARLELGRSARPWSRGGRIAGIELAGERVAAGGVVVAAGPWSPGLVDPSGAWRPIRPVWGVVVDIELAMPPRHVLEQADIDIEPAPVSDEAAARVGERDFSLVPSGAVSALGSTFLPDEPHRDALVPDLVAHGTRFVPGIAHRSPGRRSGVCAATIVRRPAAARANPGDRRAVGRRRSRPVGDLDRSGQRPACRGPRAGADHRAAAGARPGPVRAAPGHRLSPPGRSAPAVRVGQEERRLRERLAEARQPLADPVVERLGFVVAWERLGFVVDGRGRRGVDRGHGPATGRETWLDATDPLARGVAVGRHRHRQAPGSLSTYSAWRHVSRMSSHRSASRLAAGAPHSSSIAAGSAVAGSGVAPAAERSATNRGAARSIRTMAAYPAMVPAYAEWRAAPSGAAILPG